jgi:hypothetical protein
LIVDNYDKNGKMNTKTYVNVILPALQAYILQRGGEWVLWQDRDSAHISKATLKWMEKHGMDYILSPSKSPDLSIMETYASLIKRTFYNKRCNSEKQGIKRFYEVWRNLGCERINNTIDSYTKRLEDCKNKYQGWATKY